MRKSVLELDAIPPYSFELTVHPPGWFWNNPLEIFSEGKLWTAIQLSSGNSVGLRLESLGSVEQPRVLASFFSRLKLTNGEENEAIKMVVEGAGLKEDIREFYAAIKNDPILKHAIKDLYGMRTGDMLHTRIFNSAILAITLQNAPMNRTRQMLKLLITNYGQRIQFDNRAAYTWPSPQSITNATAEELTEKCKLGYRAPYLKSIAEAISEGVCPTLKELAQMPFEKARAELKELKGIGEYSAEAILPHAEAFPIDIWSAQIFWKLFFPDRPLPPKNEAIQLLRKHAQERWGRWRKLAFVYILCDLENLLKS